MADTKRGRERKGLGKQDQFREYEVALELRAEGEALDFEDLYDEGEEIEVGDG